MSFRTANWCASQTFALRSFHWRRWLRNYANELSFKSCFSARQFKPFFSQGRSTPRSPFVFPSTVGVAATELRMASQVPAHMLPSIYCRTGCRQWRRWLRNVLRGCYQSLQCWPCQRYKGPTSCCEITPCTEACFLEDHLIQSASIGDALRNAVRVLLGPFTRPYA